MNVKTIEERLKKKADKIGTDRAAKSFNNHSELREAFKLCADSYGVNTEKRKIVNFDGWDVAEVCKAAMTKMYQAQALEELRAELIDMQDRLSEITQK
jgi:hypothetical protein